MNQELRDRFDLLLNQVLEQFPEAVHQLLEQVPMYVEDFPSQGVMRQLGIKHRSHLCGLYTGIPLTHRSVQHSGVLSDAIQIFREGIIQHANNLAGKPSDEELKRQIRITILHELGHHHGLTEDDLTELGYG
ncbi:MAG: metallopeptidase family protein [Pirellulales bacterium]